MNTYAVIMAGGSGTRFWPASRVDNPKQFLDILGIGRTLIQQTYDRLTQSMPADHIHVIADQRYQAITLRQLDQMPAANYISEPGKKNTAPCALLSAIQIAAKDPEAVIVTCPSDHLITNEAVFTDVISRASQIAQDTASLVTLGIQPNHPATGYGYIEYDSGQSSRSYKVKRFVEKPDASTAQGYLDSGNFVWNSGIFIWTAKSIMAAFQEHAPSIYRPMATLLQDPTNTELIASCYANVESESVDYAIMERAENIEVIPVDFGWSDLGTWNSLYDHFAEEATDTVDLSSSSLVASSPGTIIKSYSGRTIVVDGLENFIVVDMDDVLMIYPKGKEQLIKETSRQVISKVPDLA